MKKIISLTFAILFIFTLTACGNAETRGKTTIYSFSGGNESFSVSNGVIVLTEDEETFSGGDLQILRKSDFSNAVSLRTEFYILRDGEEWTVLVSELHDMTGDSSVSFSGDLGKVSSGTIVSEGRSFEEVDFELLNNLYFRLTVTESDGTGRSYSMQLHVENV